MPSSTTNEIAAQIIVALVDIVTGGSASASAPPTGIYRSGPDIVRFFMRNGYHDAYGNWSRVAHTEEKVREILVMADGPGRILRLVEDAVNPVDYVGREENLGAAVEHLNRYLALHDLELRWDGRRHRLYNTAGTSSAVTEALRAVDALDFDSCNREFDRALSNLDRDPAASITAASSTLESIAKTMLARLGEPLPSEQTVGPMVRAVMRRLALAPEQQDDQDVRRTVGGLANVVEGIGALRTKVGSAHGRGEGHVEPIRDLAELCVNSASAAALFLLKAYERSRNH